MQAALPDRLVDAIYDASLDRTAWPDALELVGAQFRGAPANITVSDLGKAQALRGISADFEADVRHAAARAKLNPMLSFARRIPLHTAVDQAVELGGADAFKSLDVYADVYRPQRLLPLFGTVMMRNQRTLIGLSLHRPDHWAAASAADMALGERISRHVGRALELGRLLAPDRATSSFEAALLATSTPILLLNDAQELTWINEAAEYLLRAGDGLRLDRRALIATGPGDQERLVRALALTAQGARAALMVQRAAEPLPLVLRLLPLPRSQVTAGARILIQISEPEAPRPVDLAEAAALFKLTPGEARVACAICVDARTLGEVAAALRISLNTVKTQLKRVYDKTGARSRHELSMLLANGTRAPDILND